MSSKHTTTQYNHFTRIERKLYSTYRHAKRFQLNLDEFLENKRGFVFEDPGYKKLSQYYIGKLAGLNDCLFRQVQTELTEWLLYYVNKAGKTVYVKKWEKLPEYIKDNGNFNGNHFWKQTDYQKKNKGELKPFGMNPSIGTGRKGELK